MTEQNLEAQAEQKPVEAPVEAKPTLEDLYDEYDVGASNGDVPAAPLTEQTQPDNTDIAAIRQELAQLRRDREAEMQNRETAKVEADLKKAVESLGKEAGIEGKESLLRGFLIARAPEDQRLRALWEQRNEKPKAWRTALKILSEDVRQEFNVANPQLEENQRAMDESQRLHSTSAPDQPKPEERVMKMSESEFQQFWGRLAGRG